MPRNPIAVLKGCEGLQRARDIAEVTQETFPKLDGVFRHALLQQRSLYKLKFNKTSFGFTLQRAAGAKGIVPDVYVVPYIQRMLARQCHLECVEDSVSVVEHDELLIQQFK